jgi:hypothetical protein
MQIGTLLASTTVLLTLLFAGSPMAVAQAGRPWVDPPAGLPGSSPMHDAGNPAPAAPPPQSPSPPAVPAPATPPAQSAQPQTPIVRPEAPATQQAEQPKAVPPAASTPAAPPPAVTDQAMKDPDAEKRRARAATAKAFAIDYLHSWSAPNDAALEATAAFYAPRVLFHGREVTMQRLFNEKRRFVRRWPERDYRPREDGIGTVCNPAGEICTVHAVFDYTASHPKRRRVSQGTGALQLVVHFIGDKPVIVAEHSTLLGQERRRNLALEGASNDR